MKTKKSLGQNFLRDVSVVEKIYLAVRPLRGETIIEVGPGEGVLTEALARTGACVIAVELDDRLIPKLREKFREFENVEIVHGDILDVDIEQVVKSHKSKVESRDFEVFSIDGINLPPSRGLDTSPQLRGGGDSSEAINSYRVVGNLPYYITSKIIRMFLELEHPPREMFFMVQKEVAERICAKPDDMSVLSVAVQYYAKPEIVFHVPAEAFEPAPKVDSIFLRITSKAENRKETMDNQKDTEVFFRLVKMGFSARRKTLANNLAAGLQCPRQEIEEILCKAELSPKARAQDLSVGEWENLSHHL